MDSHFPAMISRMQELEARISAFSPPAPPNLTPNSGAITPSAENNLPSGAIFNPRAKGCAPRPFDVMLARAGGSVSLRPIAPGSDEQSGSNAGMFAPNIETLVTQNATKNGLDPALVRAVIEQESGGNPRSVSAVGAKGLMQLMPDTARGLGVSDPFDPAQNIAGGTRYLAGLVREFGGDTSLALAAYNAGPGAVRKYGGIPPYHETQQYVKRVLHLMNK